MSFEQHTAQHFVLDLEQVVRIEERAVVKERIGHGVGMRMGSPVLAQSFLTAGALA